MKVGKLEEQKRLKKNQKNSFERQKRMIKNETNEDKSLIGINRGQGNKQKKTYVNSATV